MRALMASLLLVVVAAPFDAFAYEDLRLADLAAHYRAQVLARQTDSAGTPAAREAGVARDPASTDAWLTLSRAWEDKTPPDLERALAAAYNAYVSASADGQRAKALFRLSELYESSDDVAHALMALRRGLTLQEDRRLQRRHDRLAQRYGLHLRNVTTEAESERPRFCMEFDQELDATGATRYRDYVELDPAEDYSVSASERRLCVTGVRHGTKYAVRLREGLPDARGVASESGEAFTVAIPDRSPTLSFTGGRYILPRGGSRDIALTSVNVPRAKLSLFHINDRNLIAEILDRRVAGLWSGWDMRSVEENRGALVWEGEIDLETRPNQDVDTAVPTARFLDDPQAGIYVLTATPADGSAQNWDERATQWLLVSDIGLTGYSGADGLSLFLRSLDSAEPIEGITVRLIARNNRVLAETASDADGAVRFDPGLTRGAGGDRPAAVMAFDPAGDFNLLDLTQPAFDLSDRGVEGRPAPGPVDVYMYTERGVYRPGETVHLTALVRDDHAGALPDLPLTLKIIRPDGTEHARRLLDSGDRAGGHAQAIELPDSARTGAWSVEAFADPEAPAVGSAGFQVEDFVPERLAVSLDSAAERLAAGETVQVFVDARYLYGAPGAGLKVDGDVTLRRAANPYPRWKGYSFGLAEVEWRAKRLPLPSFETDAEGKGSAAVRIDDVSAVSVPLEAAVRLTVNESGGRAVSRVLRLPVTARPFDIGIRSSASEDVVPRGAPATFQVIAVDSEGALLPGRFEYELIRETYRYHWFRRGNEWDYKAILSEEVVESGGSVQVSADGPAPLSLTLDWGRYRLEVRDPDGRAASSVRFRSGWYGAARDPAVPDKLTVSLDKERYAAGDVARVHVRPPFDAKVLLAVVDNRIRDVMHVDVPQSGRVVEVPVGADWDAGAYVTATAFRPTGAGPRGAPSRAVGVAWIARDMSERTLSVAIDAPDVIQPRRTVDVRLTLTGAAAGGEAFVTLAAVDQGILQLTDYDSPSPAEHYFGKRQLGVGLRDVYGRLLEPTDAPRGAIRQGGDTAARHLGGLDASSVKTVSLFSGIVAVEDDGTAVVPLAVPDFNGQLRLMAVAYDTERVGQAERDMIVRDLVVSQVTLPRFLAPGDEARMTVRLHNVDGPAGDYRIDVRGAGAVEVAGDSARRLSLTEDARDELSLALSGAGAGTGQITMTLEGPADYRLERRWDLAVRPAQALQSKTISRRIEPGESMTVTADLLDAYVPGSAALSVTYRARPALNLDVAGLVRSLDRYPYGCLEQTTSRALPLLYVSDVATSIGIAEDDAALHLRVQRAVNHVLTMQSGDGSFGMWSSFDRREDWLSAYAMDFLGQAREAGYAVPEHAYERGMDWLAQSVASIDFPAWQLPARAYAFYVLAQEGRANIGDLRYMHDVYLESIPAGLPRAHLGAALAAYGDTARAEQAFAAAFRARGQQRHYGSSRGYWYYGGQLRDTSAVAYLAAQSGVAGDRLPELIQRIGGLHAQRRYTSTQEKAWLLMLIHRLAGAADSFDLTLAGRALPRRSDPYFLKPDTTALEDGVTALNRGDAPLWQTISIEGVPRDDLAEAHMGLVVSRAFYTLDGEPADLEAVTQGDVLVAVINGEATNDLLHQALVVDLLPAGFEIENGRLGEGRAVDDLGWLPKLSRARHIEPRDDRFVAAIDLDKRGQAFTFAYLVRAVTPGSFRLPATLVEDMYLPDVFARTEMGRVTIRPGG